MSYARILGWLLLAVWAAWMSAAQGALAAHVAAPAWVPDLALALLVALAARVRTDDMPKLALSIAAARVALSIDPPAAILAGFLGAIALARALRSVVEISGALPRTLLALFAAGLVRTWLALVHDVRCAAQSAQLAALAPQPLDLLGALGSAWPTALSTALFVLVAAPALARLPGLSVLTQDREWHVVASAR